MPPPEKIYRDERRSELDQQDQYCPSWLRDNSSSVYEDCESSFLFEFELLDNYQRSMVNLVKSVVEQLDYLVMESNYFIQKGLFEAKEEVLLFGGLVQFQDLLVSFIDTLDIENHQDICRAVNETPRWNDIFGQILNATLLNRKGSRFRNIVVSLYANLPLKLLTIESSTKGEDEMRLKELVLLPVRHVDKYPELLSNLINSSARQKLSDFNNSELQNCLRNVNQVLKEIKYMKESEMVSTWEEKEVRDNSAKSTIPIVENSSVEEGVFGSHLRSADDFKIIGCKTREKPHRGTTSKSWQKTRKETDTIQRMQARVWVHLGRLIREHGAVLGEFSRNQLYYGELWRNLMVLDWEKSTLKQQRYITSMYECYVDKMKVVETETTGTAEKLVKLANAVEEIANLITYHIHLVQYLEELMILVWKNLVHIQCEWYHKIGVGKLRQSTPEGQCDIMEFYQKSFRVAKEVIRGRK